MINKLKNNERIMRGWRNSPVGIRARWISIMICLSIGARENGRLSYLLNQMFSLAEEGETERIIRLPFIVHDRRDHFSSARIRSGGPTSKLIYGDRGCPSKHHRHYRRVDIYRWLGGGLGVGVAERRRTQRINRCKCGMIYECI